MRELSEKEKHKLECMMLFDGYTEYETDFFESEEYKKLRIAMLDGFPLIKDKRLNFKFCDKRELLRAGRYVVDKHCGGIDLKVPYTNGDDLETQLISRFGEKPSIENYDEILQYIKNNIELVRVTDLPLLLNVSKNRNAYVSATWFYSFDDLDKSFFEKIPNCVHSINLSGPCDELAKTIYVHEMYHALLNRHKGSIKNLLDREFLSIFMEKVAAYDLDSLSNFLELKNLSRLLAIKMNILDKTYDEYKGINTNEDIIGYEMYIISGLLATDLFNTYLKGSNRLRHEIDNSINEVLMGNGVIEDVLSKYEVSLEKGSKIMRKQIKHFS